MTKAKQVTTLKSRKAKPAAAPKASRSASAGKTEKSATVTAAVPPPSTTKRELIEALVRRVQGATMADLITTTAWQAHSIRAVISGFRKTGSSVTRDKASDGTTRYRIEKSV